MNALLDQFVQESRECLQGIADKLMALERRPDDGPLMNDLFRLVHTLKGNSGLFDFPWMTRVLHAGEDLMDAVRDGRAHYSADLADRLLDAMDFVGQLVDEAETAGELSNGHAPRAESLARELRALIPATTGGTGTTDGDTAADPAGQDLDALLDGLPPAVHAAVAERHAQGADLVLVRYRPEEECFFKGEDPFHQARQTPGAVWGSVLPRGPWPQPLEFDCYRCVVDFVVLSSAALDAVEEHFRYVPEQVTITRLAAGGGSAVESTAPPPAADAPAVVTAALDVLRTQVEALAASRGAPESRGRMEAIGRAIAAAHESAGAPAAGLADAVAEAQRAGTPDVLERWLDASLKRSPWATAAATTADAAPTESSAATDSIGASTDAASQDASPKDAEDPRFGRRAEDALGSKVLKVDQARIDRLMNLIGEMVVAKNALPYLANRAEHQYGVRELSREIKSQYGVINRIAEEMQDAIMQVRMMPVSFVFQRFPRLVRDLSRRLGKEVDLVLEGEDTEADKNIVEALADPLIHIVRNSLDHGLELPEVRAAAGKPRAGRLAIRARQESDSAVIEVSDDGRGIDPAIIRRKAYEKGLIDEQALERLSDDEAVNLVFRPGFSTAESVSDLSGRGVGMDVVRNAIDKVGGSIALTSRVGEGTTIRLSLPLSMAITNVMIVESDRQIFGVPMTQVVETVRLPRTDVRTIKTQKTVVLRDRLVPLKALNDLLAVNAEPVANADDELAALVVKTDGGQVGLLVDDFREVIDVILKPLPGELSKIGGYAGTALLGDGSVLMVLNPKELI